MTQNEQEPDRCPDSVLQTSQNVKILKAQDLVKDNEIETIQ